jgi:PhnB protein
MSSDEQRGRYRYEHHRNDRERPMTARLSPYLGFRDDARAAMEHYRDVFGGELSISTFAEYQASEDPAEQDKVMHAELTTSGGMVLMASDTPNGMERSTGNAFSVSVSGEDESELRGYWAGLSDGGTVVMPLEAAPWGDVFGMCTDRFGVSWMINITGAAATSDR